MICLGANDMFGFISRSVVRLVTTIGTVAAESHAPTKLPYPTEVVTQSWLTRRSRREFCSGAVPCV